MLSLSLTFCLLFLSILSCFLFRQRFLLYSLLSFTHLIAYIEKVENLTGFIFMAVFSIFVFLAFLEKYVPHALQLCLRIIVFVFMIAFFFHLVPGYHNIIVINNVLITKNSIPFKLYLNFDKTMASLSLFVFSSLFYSENKIDLKSFLWTLSLTAFCLFIIFYPAFALKFVRYEFKINQFFPIWAFDNLFFTCFAEEVFFRGFIQNQIKVFFSTKGFGFAAIIIASLIFGAIHYPGGLVYVLLAALAALFYGAVYEKTNRILCAVFIHFILNLTHFIFFTYPAAAKIH